MTQRIPSAVSDQYIYFVARDSGGSLLTGLTTFTVYRARNGGTATAYTTPTVAEVSSANMPGVYSLLIDEDTTITTGDNVNMMALYITQASMVPVIDVIELYRTVITAGQTLAVTGSNINALNASIITAASIANDAITDAKVASDVTIASVTGAVGSVTAAVTLPTMPADWITSSGVAASAVTEIQTGLSTLDAAGVRSAVGLASANLDSQLGVIATDTTTDIPAQIAALNNFNPATDTVAHVTLVDTTTTNTDMRGTDGANTTAPDNAGITAIKAKTDNLPAAPAAVGDIPTTAQNADAVWDEALAGHVGAGSAGAALSAAGAGGDPWATVIESGYTAYEVLRLLAAHAAGTATGLNGSAAFKGLDGTTTRIAGTVDGVNRTITALDGT